MTFCSECGDEVRPQNLETCEECGQEGLCDECVEPEDHDCVGDDDGDVEDDLDFGDGDEELWEDEDDEDD